MTKIKVKNSTFGICSLQKPLFEDGGRLAASLPNHLVSCSHKLWTACYACTQQCCVLGIQSLLLLCSALPKNNLQNWLLISNKILQPLFHNTQNSNPFFFKSIYSPLQQTLARQADFLRKSMGTLLLVHENCLANNIGNYCC